MRRGDQFQLPTTVGVVRIVVPVAILIAGMVLIGAGASVGGRALGLALILIAGVVAFANALLRVGLGGTEDRDAEERARRRYVRTGRWN